MEIPSDIYRTLESLTEIQCTIDEAAAFLRMSSASFKKMIKEDPVAKEIWERGAAKGRASLRRLQWRHAMGFGPQAVAMTVHLSKHWLGETDKSQLEIGGTININSGVRSATDIMLDGIKTSLLSQQETIELAELCDLIDESGVASLKTSERIRFFTLVNKGTPPPEAEQSEEEQKMDTVPALPSPAPENRAV